MAEFNGGDEKSSDEGTVAVDLSCLEEVVKITNKVYGVFPGTDDAAKASEWMPKSYKYRQRRYLWTDAFGVINFLTLYQATKNENYLLQAQSLIKDVHNTLGYTRDGKSRLGKASDDHPTLGGLRIGKVDKEGEEDGDGQYFHYLTKWMYALNRMSMITNDIKYNNWTIELAKSIFPHFVDNSAKSINIFGRPRMFWKMSIDLTHCWVNAEGNLDPIDGYITYKLLQSFDNQYNKKCDNDDNKQCLEKEIQVFEEIVKEKYPKYRSSDCLDLGESLWVSHWFLDEPWAQHITYEALNSLNRIYKNGEFDYPSKYRLAFREFGMTLGVQSIYYQLNNMQKRSKKMEQAYEIAKLWNNERVPALLQFWRQNNGIYSRDNDITPMMFCSSLMPMLWIKNAKLLAK